MLQTSKKPAMDGNDLRVVNLSSQRINAIPYDVLARADRTISLDLSYIYLENLSNVSSLRKFENLTALHLNRCGLLQLPDVLFYLTKLQILKMNNNFMEKGLSPSICKLKELQELHISSCNLSKLPEELWTLTKLEELTLSKLSDLTELCSSFGELQALKTLKIDQCVLTRLPDSFGSLRYLEELTLASVSGLTELCSSFGELQALKTLTIEHCALTQLPDSFGSLRCLEHLILRDNRLCDYPACTLKLPNLCSLDLSSVLMKKLGNTINDLPINLKDTCLKRLVLDGNPIVMPSESIWKQGVDAIKSFMTDLTSGKKLLCADTINMIGESEAGKTSMAMSLVNGEPVAAAEDDRTRVMQRLRANLSPSSTDTWIHVNDFGGHHIYRSVIPLFLPFNGLAILAYNLTATNWSDQESKVEDWILTAIAKSAKIRLVIAGTRSDLVTSDETRSGLNEKMRNFVVGVENKLKSDVKKHIRKLTGFRCRESNASRKSCLDKRLNELVCLQRKAEEAKLSFATVSCHKSYNDLQKFWELVTDSVKPPEVIPARWWPLIQDILNMDKEDNVGFPCRTMDQVKEMYIKHISDDPQCKNLPVILRYLASSSQILWIENDPRLVDSIFHSPQQMVAICRKCLDHRADENPARKRDQAAQQASQCGKNNDDDCTTRLPPEWADATNKKIKMYKSEILQLSLLEKLLSPEYTKKEVGEAIAFMESFNLISEIEPYRVTEELEKRTFVITSNLPEEEPQELKTWTEKLRGGTSIVCISLSFVGCIVPLSFFETSLSSILTVAGVLSKRRAVTKPWHDGVYISHNYVLLLVQRLDQEMNFTACAQSGDRSAWLILYPVLERLQQNISASWPGVPLNWEIVCPGCRWLNKGYAHRREGRKHVLFQEFTSHLTEGQKAGFEKLSFDECSHSVPRCLCHPIFTDYLTTEQQTEILAFYEKLDFCNVRHGKEIQKLCQELAESTMGTSTTKLIDAHDSHPIDELLQDLCQTPAGSPCDVAEEADFKRRKASAAVNFFYEVSDALTVTAKCAAWRKLTATVNEAQAIKCEDSVAVCPTSTVSKRIFSRRLADGYWPRPTIRHCNAIISTAAILCVASATSVQKSLNSKLQRLTQLGIGDLQSVFELELFRLASLADWRHVSKLSALRCSSAGFYRKTVVGTQSAGDGVSCFSCGCTVEHWPPGVHPMAIHRDKCAHHCRFVAEPFSSGNVPLSNHLLQIPVSERTDEAVAAARSMPTAEKVTAADCTSSLGVRPGATPHGARVLGVYTEAGLAAVASGSSLVKKTSKRNDGIQSSAGSVASAAVRDDALEKYESYRLNTFAEVWTYDHIVDSRELSRNGFLYAGPGDRVRCAFCQGLLRNWELGDRVDQLHAQHFTYCRFVQGHDVGNVPIPFWPLVATPLANVNASAMIDAMGADLGITCTQPRNPEFAIETRRLSTFATWPATHQLQPETVAKAGFFYLGKEDAAQCFFCDGVVVNWQNNCDPWIEHAWRFPTCSFLVQVKGHDFVRRHRVPETPAASSSTTSLAVDPREVRARVDSNKVRIVLNMDYPLDLIREVIQKRLSIAGSDHETSEQLLDDIFRTHDEKQKTNSAVNAERRPTHSSAGPVVSSGQPARAEDVQPVRTDVTGFTHVAVAASANAAATTGGPLTQYNQSMAAENIPPQVSLPVTALSPEDDNRQLKTQLTCKVCMDSLVGIVFLPCGHLVCCASCSPAMTTCPICRVMVRGTVRTIL